MKSFYYWESLLPLYGTTGVGGGGSMSDGGISLGEFWDLFGSCQYPYCRWHRKGGVFAVGQLTQGRRGVPPWQFHHSTKHQLRVLIPPRALPLPNMQCLIIVMSIATRNNYPSQHPRPEIPGFGAELSASEVKRRKLRQGQTSA
jgi:hypothetical protein